MKDKMKLPDLSFVQNDDEAVEFVILFAIRAYVLKNLDFLKVFPNSTDLKVFLPQPYNDTDLIDETLKKLIRRRQIKNNLVPTQSGIDRLKSYDKYVAEKEIDSPNYGISHADPKKPVVVQFQRMQDALLLRDFSLSTQPEEPTQESSHKSSSLANYRS